MKYCLRHKEGGDFLCPGVLQKILEKWSSLRLDLKDEWTFPQAKKGWDAGGGHSRKVEQQVQSRENRVAYSLELQVFCSKYC